MASGSIQFGGSHTYLTSKISMVWKYFTKENPKIVKCKVCKRHLRYTGSTTTMRQHLDKRHPLVLAMAGDSLSTPPADVVAAAGRQFDRKSSLPSAPAIPFKDHADCNEDTVTEAVCSFITQDMMAVSVVSGEGFKRLFQVLAPSYEMPSMQYFEDLLHTKYLAGRETLKTLIKSVDTVALSCYILSGVTSHALVVMVHLIDKMHKVKNFVLSTCEVPDEKKRKAVDILQLVLDSLSEYDLDEGKIVAVVHDNCNSMAEAMDLLKQAMNCEPLKCMGVLLSDCINSALVFPDVSETIIAARCLAAYFKPGTTSAAELGKSAGDIVQDLTQHWTSIFETSRSLIRQQPNILAVIKKDPESPNLTDQQWITLHAIVEVLSPLAGAVQVLSQEQFVSVSSMRAILHSMEKKLEVGDDDPASIRKLKETIHTSLKEHFQLEAVFEKPHASTIATALDPRHKTLKYHTSEQQQQMKKSLSEVAENHLQRLQLTVVEVEIEESQSAKRRKSGMSDLLGSDSEDSEEESKQHSRMDSEIQAYACDKVMSKENDPVEWWHLNESRYPSLVCAANAYLCIPCTAALPHDAFTKKQVKLKAFSSEPNPDLLECLMFLNCNKILEL